MTPAPSPASGSARPLPRLLLASQSPRRKAILAELGVPFEVIRSPYQERAEDVEHLTPVEQAGKLASLKAFHAAKNLHDGLVIGADTIVVVDETILGKPRDPDDARRMLESLSGRAHQVITGLALVDPVGLRTVSRAEITKVFFKELSDREIRHYVNSPEPYDKAGAYAIQGLAALFVERIEGCYFNVVGFPIMAFSRLIKELGHDLLDWIKESRHA
ncbi:MAG: Septum formation protein Maf [Candidatus Ozemobacter sibiricus]|jgi:septum formation protein|uniref:dTTP/UTP pyrophosphatase n=1 Tax=Candidatus Ozemobacter sibiricus TaxID=2268124 RepID=A0A367ZP83_9BACT|nr:MAG: Septum formation protein Maf [Candidatus Ozemobacter sibiricus]